MPKLGRFLGGIKRYLIGKRLLHDENKNHKLSRWLGLSMLSPDAISSIAYGPEQMYIALAAVGFAAFWWALPLGFAVVGLLAALIISYKQIIKAYPDGGGGYVVCSKNIGPYSGLVAGGCLLLDYMLTVAVSVSAGADAIISAFPSIGTHNVFISLLLILLITIVNLRGIGESATILLIPVYLFVLSMLVTFGVGFFKLIFNMDNFSPVSHFGQTVPNLTLFIILRAFSVGSSSLTGVEAISNAVPIFKEPRVKNASRTLVYMGIVLALFFISIVTLSYFYGLVPMIDNTLLAQLGEKIFGGQNILFYILQISTVLILSVAASTGFNGFPSIAYNMAKDKYMPHAFLNKGARLVYSNGIVTLAAGAVLLIVLFKGETSKLIPLYAIGVFIPFTLSQAGMIIKWFKERNDSCSWVLKALPNMIGTIVTFGIVAILFATHFFLPILSLFIEIDGIGFSEFDVWPFFIILPLLMRLFLVIKKHYTFVAKELSRKQTKSHNFDGNIVILLVGNVTSVVEDAIKYANTIADSFIALRVNTGENPEKDAEVFDEFTKSFPDIPLEVIESKDRLLTPSIVNFVKKMSDEAIKSNLSTTVLIPEFQPKHQWQTLLHNQTALRIKLGLGENENVIVSSFTYQLKV